METLKQTINFKIMKKFFSLSVLLTGLLLTVYSCDDVSEPDLVQNEKHSNVLGSVSYAKYSNLTEEQLIDSLSNDADFIQVGDELVDFFVNIPNRESFLVNYNEEDFENGKEEYFLNLTGYANEQVVTTLTSIHQKLGNVLEKYPQLRYDGTNEEFINTIIDEAYAKAEEAGRINTYNSACDDCVKKWKPRMITATIVGGIIGGATGGFIGAWGGAVLGFASTGWSAVDCLEAAGC